MGVQILNQNCIGQSKKLIYKQVHWSLEQKPYSLRIGTDVRKVYHNQIKVENMPQNSLKVLEIWNYGFNAYSVGSKTWVQVAVWVFFHST